MEPEILYKFMGFDILEFTGRWKVKNKELYVEVKYHYMAGSGLGIYQSIEETFADSERITWDEEWPIMNQKAGMC